jgi:hypothetical protein
MYFLIYNSAENAVPAEIIRKLFAVYEYVSPEK